MPDLTTSANVDTLMQAATFAAFRTSLGLGTGNTPTFSGVISTAGLQSYRTNAEGVCIGDSAGSGNPTSDAINIGFFTGQATGSNTSCVNIGRHAGSFAVGNNSVRLGHAAGQYAFSSANSVIIGYLAGRNPTQVALQYNFSSVIIGHEASTSSTSAQTSVIIGSQAGKTATDTVGSVLIGYGAGEQATNSRYSVYIGSNAGKTLNRNSSLVIESNDTYTGSSSLIYGEFDNRKLQFNGLTTILGNASGPTAFAVTSTTQGFLLPRMTKTQRDAIGSPVAGLQVYQTDNTPGLRTYNGTNWMKYTEATD